MLRRDRRGRLRVYLGRSLVSIPGWRRVRVTIRRNRRWVRAYAWVHPACNSGGWQWVGRYLEWERTGKRPPTNTHMHHRDGDRANDEAKNFEPLPSVAHGRLHASAARRDAQGRFAAAAK